MRLGERCWPGITTLHYEREMRAKEKHSGALSITVTAGRSGSCNYIPSAQASTWQAEERGKAGSKGHPSQRAETG